MKVIVAGFPKTGTKTLNAALTELGYKVYDYPENGFELHEEWGKIFHKGWTISDFKRMYKDADAVVDVPACYFWEEIHKAFPDAKIILSLRETEEEWLKSFENQMKCINLTGLWMIKHLSPSFRRMERNMEYPFSSVIFGIPDVRVIGHKPYNKELLKLKYRAHNAHVLQNAPKDKLLVYKVTEGWEPLCKFLGIPVPDKPFPHKNKGGKYMNEVMAFHPAIIKMQREMGVSMLVYSLVIGIGGYYVYKHGLNDIWKSIANMAIAIKLPFLK